MQRGKEGTGRRKKGGNGKREGVRERREGWNGRRKGSQNIEVQNPEPWGKEEVSAKYKKQKHRNKVKPKIKFGKYCCQSGQKGTTKPLRGNLG